MSPSDPSSKDLATTFSDRGSGSTNNLSCSCTSLDQFQRASSAEYLTPSDSSTSSDIHPYSPMYPQYPFAPGFPYSPQHSAQVCLRAALLISRTFESLPYPRPLLETHHQQRQTLPRTMPSFACCLMQSSYAMLMLFYKARVANQLSPDSENEIASNSTDHLVEQLRQGLQRIIAAVSNYSLAFEALDGMRGRSLCLNLFPLATIPSIRSPPLTTSFRRNSRCISNSVSCISLT